MRIRKRLLSSSLSLLPLSDPQLTRPPVGQPHLPGGAQIHLQANLDNSQPSDLPNPTIASERARWMSPHTELKEVEGEEVKEERFRKEEGKSSNDTREGGSILGAEVGTELLPPLSASSDCQGERWDAGDRSVPLKKRRGSFGREKEMRAKAKMKSKTNKKLLHLHCENGEERRVEEDEGKEGGGSSKHGGGVKKVKKGNVIMEGSRCSRVNGRGWRCCQQTLVGYSLCEHHLGKGRLRSMTSVRGRAKRKEESEPGILVRQNGDDDFEEDEESTKKKVKLGVVKARSISSLLGQTSNALVISDNVKNAAGV
ncbi:hypothetical protein NMG60_11001858 [Bertholletia excelsa]